MNVLEFVGFMVAALVFYALYFFVMAALWVGVLWCAASAFAYLSNLLGDNNFLAVCVSLAFALLIALAVSMFEWGRP